MTEKIRIFRSPESEAEYQSAYDGMLALWPVPYEELYIPTRFGETHVIASGPADAPPLLLFHSAGSGAVQWFRNVQAFSRRYRTYCVDVVGEVNRSRPAQRLTRREEFVAWMGEVLDGLRIREADMVGNSFGGFLVFSAALYMPERVRRAVLISPAAVFAQIWAWYWHLAFPYKIGYALRSRRMILGGFDWIWAGFPREGIFKQFSELGKTSGFTCNQLPPPVYSDAELRQVRVPLLLLIGDHEVIYDPARVIRRAAKWVPGLQAEIVPDANHNAQVTAPEWVNQKVLEFLAGEV